MRDTLINLQSVLKNIIYFFTDWLSHEHISIPEEIGPVSTMQKNEMIADLPALPHISEVIFMVSSPWEYKQGGSIIPIKINRIQFTILLSTLSEGVAISAKNS